MTLRSSLLACALAALALPAIAQESGMTVSRDPATGALRAPTASELRALQSRMPQPAAGRPAPAVVRPDGSRIAEVGERGMVYSTATRSADGRLSHKCIEGATHDAAHGATHGATHDATQTHDAASGKVREADHAR